MLAGKPYSAIGAVPSADLRVYTPAALQLSSSTAVTDMAGKRHFNSSPSPSGIPLTTGTKTPAQAWSTYSRSLSARSWLLTRLVSQPPQT